VRIPASNDVVSRSSLAPSPLKSPLSSVREPGRKLFSAKCSSVPSEAAAFQSLLELFLIEKALYELRYEIAQRPDWIGIPLTGLIELCE